MSKLTRRDVRPIAMSAVKSNGDSVIEVEEGLELSTETAGMPALEKYNSYRFSFANFSASANHFADG